MPNEYPTHFCTWMLHSSSYACLDKGKLFANLEHDIAYFKVKRKLLSLVNKCSY